MRRPMVTRSIKSTNALVTVVNVETHDVFDQNVVLPRTYKDEKAVLKMAEKVLEGSLEPIKVLAVKSFEVTEGLYGMTEEEFVMAAKPLPPRAKKGE